MSRADPWDSGDAYDRFMGRWSELVAARFVPWLDLGPGASWLDIGTGTGVVLRAIAGGAAPSRLAGVEPSERFLAIARDMLPASADLRVGDAEHVPFPPGEFDAVVCGLVLNFTADPATAIGAMRHACRPGGVVAAYVWDYADGMRFLRHFWDVATELDPEAATLDEGLRRFPLCRPEPLAKLFRDAGLLDVNTDAIDVEREFAGFDEYWDPFLAGQGPAGGYLRGLDADDRRALAETLRSRLPTAADGSIRLTARAWAVRGRN